MTTAQNRILFGREEIHRRMREISWGCKRFDFCSYYAGTGSIAMNLLSRRENSRIIVGGINERFKAVSMAYATEPYKARVRYLEGCHIKLYIFYDPKPHVVLGSMNLGGGMIYEIATEITGQPAKDCAMHFNELWNCSSPVNPTELEVIATDLKSAVFEQT